MTLARSLKSHSLGALTMLTAAPLTLGAVLALNGIASLETKKAPTKSVSMVVKRVPPKKAPPKKSTPPKKTQRSNKARQSAPAPMLPDLGTTLSGVDFDMPEYALVPFQGSDDEVIAGSDVKDIVHTEATVDRKPVLVEQTPISIPDIARQKNLSGRVSVKLLIGSNGRVRSCKIVKADPPGVFDRNVLSAVRRWVFEPATYQNEAVEMWVVLPLEFNP